MPQSSVKKEEIALDERAFDRTMRSLYWPKRWFGTTLHGAENLPEGAGQLIGNHGPMGLDAPFLMSLIHEHTGRAARGLIDRIWMRSAVGRRLARNVGCLLADRAVALRALAEGELVLNYPGGVQESMRPPRERYRLRWDGRTGFVRVAIQAGVPIVPVACIGMDDMVFQLVDHERMSETFWGRYVGALYGPQYVPPLMVGPVPSELHYWIGEPIHLPFAPEQADDRRVLLEGQARVRRALEAQISRGLRHRDAHAGHWRERTRRSTTRALERLRSQLQRRLS